MTDPACDNVQCWAIYLYGWSSSEELARCDEGPRSFIISARNIVPKRAVTVDGHVTAITHTHTNTHTHTRF